MANETTEGVGQVAGEAAEAAGHAADAATEALGHAAEAAGHAASAPGMPQLDLTTFPNQIFWLAITLVAIYMILSRVALPRIGGVLAERRGAITNDLSQAEELKQKAQDAEAAYEKALSDARAEAQRVIAEKKGEIQKEFALALDKANAEIAARTAESEKRIAQIRAGAQEMVAEVAREAAKDIVAVLDLTAEAKGVDAAVNARLKG